jgi:hypothetical protein
MNWWLLVESLQTQLGEKKGDILSQYRHNGETTYKWYKVIWPIAEALERRKGTKLPHMCHTSGCPNWPLIQDCPNLHKSAILKCGMAKSPSTVNRSPPFRCFPQPLSFPKSLTVVGSPFLQRSHLIHVSTNRVRILSSRVLHLNKCQFPT